MAAAALVSDLVYVPIIWFSYAPSGSSLFSMCFFTDLIVCYDLSGSVLSNRHFLAARFWLGLELFNLVAWLALPSQNLVSY